MELYRNAKFRCGPYSIFFFKEQNIFKVQDKYIESVHFNPQKNFLNGIIKCLPVFVESALNKKKLSPEHAKLVPVMQNLATKQLDFCQQLGTCLHDFVFPLVCSY